MLKFNSLKDYLESKEKAAKEKNNDLKRNLRKVDNCIKNSSNEDLSSTLAYLLRKHSYSFIGNSNDYLYEYFSYSEKIDEVVIRQFLSMNHRITNKTLSTVLELKIKDLITSDLCELLTQKKSSI
ncbi:hypothetical protein D5B42_23215 [Salmonella enterica subsp. enterica serovar Oranienburg]|nr:hypothetical protein [Salmonella enterica subsp. enterica serovar Oranienburg]